MPVSQDRRVRAITDQPRILRAYGVRVVVRIIWVGGNGFWGLL